MEITQYLIKNKDISSLSNFKTKAIARYYFEINSRQDIDILYNIKEFANKNNIKILFI
jgi:UDP-N-acetylmuramate dehydrogenase